MRRIRSVDALRGGVIALMIFVNYLGEMAGVPGWTQHTPSAVDAYTLTDLVFPWFLFLVGCSLPLSLGRYLGADGGFPWRALGRIFPRVLGLLVLGVMFVNADERYDELATGMTKHRWLAICISSAAVLWGGLPPTSSRWRTRIRGALQLLAAVVLAWALVRFRGKPEGPGGTVFLTPLWWGILGMIGWAYLVGALAYLLVRGDRTALLGLMALAFAIRLGASHDRLGVLTPLEQVWGVGEFLGSITGLVLAGAVAGGWLVKPPNTPTGAAAPLVWYGLGLWAAGWLLRPLSGYHKNAATESWALVAAGQGALLLAACHVRLDRQGARIPAGALEWCGRNALLAYLLPDWLGPMETLGQHWLGSLHPSALWQAPVACLARLQSFPYWEAGGTLGMANAAVLTLAIVLLAGACARRGVVVKL